MNTMKHSIERGQALILIALAAIGLFGIAGLAIDGSAKFSDRRHAQNAADTAALAAALARVKPGATRIDWEYAAKQRALSNGYDSNFVTNTVTVYACDDTGAHCGGVYEDNPSYVKVTIVSNVKTYFARVIGITQTQNTVEALAMSQTEYVGELYGGGSIVGLAPNECKTIWFSGGALTDIDGGGVFSNSKLDCGVTIAGSTDLHMEGGVDMVADSFTKNGNPPLSDIAGGFHGDADGYDYPPPADMLPNPTCSGAATTSGSSMTPGSYTGTFPPSGVSTLSPGTYCINGTFKLNNHETLSGTGVTIYMQSGDINWNGGAEVNLSAPTSGDLAGLLIYSPMSNSNTMRFNGNANTTLTGTIFMPAAPLVYNGTGNVNPSHVQIIGYTIELTGSNTTHVVYQDADNWDSNLPARVGLFQ